MMSSEHKIEGLNKVQLLHVLWRNAEPGRSEECKKETKWTEEDTAAAIIAVKNGFVGTFKGRVLEINLNESMINPMIYDQGRHVPAKQTISILRNYLLMNDMRLTVANNQFREPDLFPVSNLYPKLVIFTNALVEPYMIDIERHLISKGLLNRDDLYRGFHEARRDWGDRWTPCYGKMNKDAGDDKETKTTDDEQHEKSKEAKERKLEEVEDDITKIITKSLLNIREAFVTFGTLSPDGQGRIIRYLVASVGKLHNDYKQGEMSAPLSQEIC
jgi:hypothetical protein